MELLWRLKTNISLRKAMTRAVKFSEPQVILALAHSPSQSSKSRAVPKGKGNREGESLTRHSPGSQHQEEHTEAVTKLSQESR